MNTITSDAERLAFERMQTEFIREDGTVEGWHIETHYTPCKGIADADGYMRVLVDEEGYDTETRISHKLLRETGWIQAARNPGAGLRLVPEVPNESVLLFLMGGLVEPQEADEMQDEITQEEADAINDRCRTDARLHYAEILNIATKDAA